MRAVSYVDDSALVPSLVVVTDKYLVVLQDLCRSVELIRRHSDGSCNATKKNEKFIRLRDGLFLDGCLFI